MPDTIADRVRALIIEQLGLEDDEAPDTATLTELYLCDRRFDNPIVAMEVKRVAKEGMRELGQKLIQQCSSTNR